MPIDCLCPSLYSITIARKYKINKLLHNSEIQQLYHHPFTVG